MYLQWKTKIVEAIQFDGKNYQAINFWANGKAHLIQIFERGPKNSSGFYYISSFEMQNSYGSSTVQPGDWILKREDGEFFSCSKEFIEDNYIKVGETKRFIGLTFCSNCKNRHIHNSNVDICKKFKLDFVKGEFASGYCNEKNFGNCEDFDQI